MKITAKTQICGIIGNPVKHSLSPVIHNAAFQALDLDFAYLAFEPQNAESALAAMKSLGIRGFSVTIPFKLAVLDLLDQIDPLAAQIGAVNTVVNNNGCLKGYNTDWIGAVKPLERAGIDLAASRVVILGAGGAARAVAFGIQKAGCTEMTILNRTIAKAENLARELGATFGDLNEQKIIQNADVIINTSSVGMTPNDQESPIECAWLNSQMTVFDIVYKPRTTKLLQAAEAIGAKIITGEKMLLDQAVGQFKLFTATESDPYKIMAQSLDSLI